MSTGQIVASLLGVAALGTLGFLGYKFLAKPAVIQTASSGGTGHGGTATVPSSTLQNQVPLGQQITGAIDTVSNAADSISNLIGSIEKLRS